MSERDPDDEAFIMKVQARSKMLGDNQDDVLDLLDLIERGFDDIEHRIANMDKEHTKYVRATVTRMNYLLSGETDTKGLVVQLLNKMSEEPEQMEESHHRDRKAHESVTSGDSVREVFI